MRLVYRLIRWVVVLTTLAITLPALADHCPTTITQDSKGFWTSNEAPGWKSTNGKPGVTLSAKDFGGVVYSPEKKRIACVYKDSTGEWVVLLSSIDHVFEKADLKGSTWEFNDKYKDYECGTPKSTLKDCEFTVKK